MMDINNELSALRARTTNPQVDFTTLAQAARVLAIQEHLVRLRDLVPGLTGVSIEREFCADDSGGSFASIEGYTLAIDDGAVYLSNEYQDEPGCLSSLDLEDPEAGPILRAMELAPTDGLLPDDGLARLISLWDHLEKLTLNDGGAESTTTHEINKAALFCVASAAKTATGEYTAYWSTPWGWTSADRASLFTYADTLSMQLPVDRAGTVRWVAWPDRPATYVRR